MRTNRIAAGLASAIAATLAASAAAAPAAAVPGYRASDPYSAQVVRIVDGDTVDVRVGRQTRRVQLLDINAPERGQCWGAAATRRLAWRLPVGSRVRLLQDGPRRDAAGRYLAYAWNREGVLVNRDLARVGLAAVKIRPRGKFNAQALKDQAVAKQLRYGIWSGRCDVRGAYSFSRDRDRWLGPQLLRKLRIDRNRDHDHGRDRDGGRHDRGHDHGHDRGRH